MLVHDERIVRQWSHPTVLSLINFTLNDQVSSETGIRPFEAKYGSKDASYFRLPTDINVASAEFVQQLNSNLVAIRDISSKFQQSLVAARTAVTPEDKQHMLQPGDLVLFQLDPAQHLPTKLSSPFTGPYEVVQQHTNTVECRHPVIGSLHKFHVSRLKMFHGTKEDAFKLAQSDHSQYEIRAITAHRGEPLKRTTMEFEIQFEDGSLVWLPWSQDLFTSIPYEDYCRSKPALFPLIYNATESKSMVSKLNRQPITAVQPSDTVYVDLRCYGPAWYRTLGLPDCDHITYYLEYRYTKWSGKSHLKIQASCPVLKEHWPNLDHYFVRTHGSNFSQPTLPDVLITAEFLLQYPAISQHRPPESA
jgi:hypothetical protein